MMTGPWVGGTRLGWEAGLYRTWEAGREAYTVLCGVAGYPGGYMPALLPPVFPGL